MLSAVLTAYSNIENLYIVESNISMLLVVGVGIRMEMYLKTPPNNKIFVFLSDPRTVTLSYHY